MGLFYDYFLSADDIDAFGSMVHASAAQVVSRFVGFWAGLHNLIEGDARFHSVETEHKALHAATRRQVVECLVGGNACHVRGGSEEAEALRRGVRQAEHAIVVPRFIGQRDCCGGA